jgi:hypothetical protein
LLSIQVWRLSRSHATRATSPRIKINNANAQGQYRIAPFQIEFKYEYEPQMDTDE